MFLFPRSHLHHCDFATGADAHGRAEGAAAAGGVHLHIAEVIQSPVELEDAVIHPDERVELPAVRVPRQIEIDTSLLQILPAAGVVVQYHKGQNAFVYHLPAYGLNGGVAHGRVHGVAVLLVSAHVVQPHNLQAVVHHRFRF